MHWTSLGNSIKKDLPSKTTWFEYCAEWLKENGWLDRKAEFRIWNRNEPLQ